MALPTAGGVSSREKVCAAVSLSIPGSVLREPHSIAFELLAGAVREAGGGGLRARAEKQRGDDLSKIAMMLASGRGELLLSRALFAAGCELPKLSHPPFSATAGGEIIPQSLPAAANKSPSKIPEPDERGEEQTSQQRNKRTPSPPHRTVRPAPRRSTTSTQVGSLWVALQVTCLRLLL